MGDDPFKVLPWRIIGYGFGMAEAFRYRFDYKYADFLNQATSVFVIVHIVHTGLTVGGVPAVVGSIFFEGICSCLLPPVINYHLCRWTANAVWDSQSVPRVVKEWAPFLVGMLSLPILFYYVDPVIDQFIQEKIVAAL